MKSVYAIRILEILYSKMMSYNMLKKGIHIIIPVQELRECCGCENKYPAFGNFKKKVLDKAVNEINRVTYYNLTFSYQKSGKKVVAINFFIVSKFTDYSQIMPKSKTVN